MRHLAAVAVAFSFFAPAASAMHSFRDRRAAEHVLVLREHIAHLRIQTWHFQEARGAKRSETRYLERRVHDAHRLDRLGWYWYRHDVRAQRALARWQAARAAAAAAGPPHEQDWLCIHRYEGSWTDSGEPYFGGLQMDDSFMATYGAEAVRLGYLARNPYKTLGTADHWTPSEQMWVAEAAYVSGRGFYPWPNTARYCGLL